MSSINMLKKVTTMPQFNFDDMYCSGGNENFNTFNLYDYVTILKENDSQNVPVVQDNDNCRDQLYLHLKAYSNDPDSNSVSKGLVEQYKNQLQKN